MYSTGFALGHAQISFTLETHATTITCFLPSGKEAIMGICAEEQPKEVMHWISSHLHFLGRSLQQSLMFCTFLFDTQCDRNQSSKFALFFGGHI